MENKLEEIAQNIADVTLELMEDSIDWQLADFPQDGDEYDTLHSEVMLRAIEKMYSQTKHEY